MENIRADTGEILRYMGCSPREVSPSLKEQVERIRDEMEKVLSPRRIYRRYEISREGDILSFAGMKVRSSDLAKNLRTCPSCYIMGATIGPEADLLIRRSLHTSSASALMYQAAGAAFIEAWCDMVCDEISEQERERGCFLRPRFSPGYGDFSLEYQRDIFRILRLGTALGMSLSEGLLMQPSKSVTAIIGVSPEEPGCGRGGCQECGREDCLFRLT